ncbi:hypothetical protein ACIRBX_11930 [Kitasatospora sp. NPDC096147]|uniref:hypothetical protein n=1 Tax=Kitasatospora sp. NPDC096147 TaxID=3364093 RepID=UPI00382F5B1A
MSETTTTEAGTAPEGATVIPPATDEVTEWKRKWEQVSSELNELRTAQLSEQERAVQSARTEGRSTALAELGRNLAEAEIRAQAAEAGVTAAVEFLDLARFIGEDGRPDAARIGSYVATIPKAPAEPEFLQSPGAGHNRSRGREITSMDPIELANLIAGDTFN